MSKEETTSPEVVQGRVWLRKMDDGTALLLVSIISVKMADDGAFCATITGLEDSLVGMGSTEKEAIKSAGLLLRGRVDHALKHGHELTDVLGNLPFFSLSQVASASSRKQATPARRTPPSQAWMSGEATPDRVEAFA